MSRLSEYLTRLEQLASEASPGPWFGEEISERDTRPTGWGVNRQGSWDMVLGVGGANNEADARLIAEARDAVPTLCRLVRELMKETQISSVSPADALLDRVREGGR